MLGHLSFGVNDLDRAASFYDRILAPLGYVRVWANPNGVGFGEKGGGTSSPSFQSPGKQLLQGRAFTLPSLRRAAKRSMLFTPQLSRQAPRIAAPPAQDLSMAPPITPPSWSISTATSWRPSTSRRRRHRAFSGKVESGFPSEDATNTRKARAVSVSANVKPR
jgi:hypothetical protein